MMNTSTAIAGVFHLDGLRADQREAETMLAAMPHRTRGSVVCHADGPVALGAGSPSQGARLHRMGGCVIAGVARLDNRDELLAAPRLLEELAEAPARDGGARNARGSGDSLEFDDTRVILAAYRSWGPACCEHLLGDFAFAIWDAVKHTLLCARDHFGVRPLCWFKSERLLAFASEPKAVVSLSGVPAEINEERICYHFHPELLIADDEITPYRGVHRLQPAHTLHASQNRVTKRRYWQIDPEQPSGCATEQDYIERFEELFRSAVAARLPVSGGAGTTLSGGLDSSSVTCVARDLQRERRGPALPVYSARFERVPQADEGRWIDAVLQAGGIEHVVVHPDRDTPFIDLDTVLWLHDGPFYGTNYFISWQMYRAAADNGIRVMLGGDDGDTTVSHGIDLLIQLAQRGYWQRFAAECDAVTRNFNNTRTYASRNGMLAAHGLPYLRFLARSGRGREFFAGVREISRHFQCSRRRLIIDYGLKQLPGTGALKRLIRSGAASRNESAVSPVRSELLRKYRIAERVRELEQRFEHLPYPVAANYQHVAALRGGSLAYALETIDRMASYWGIDARHPFCHVPLAQFCVTVPPELKLRNGYSRYILRRGLRGSLPAAVQWRPDKGDLSDVYAYGMQEYEAANLSGLSERTAAAGGSAFLELNGAGGARSTVTGAAAYSRLWEVFTFARWLETEKTADQSYGPTASSRAKI